ncbi:hypothetical protein ACWGOE_04360 [Leucobacter chromiiresistens]
MYDPSYDPVAELAKMGIRIVRHSLKHANAIWVRERRLVIVDRGLRPDLVRPTLAHEHQHAVNGDPGGHNHRDESRAVLESAKILIDPAEWDVLTYAHDDYDRVCMELGVMRDQFLAYYRFRQMRAASETRLERIGTAVYENPKMGVGNWTRKYEVA